MKTVMFPIRVPTDDFCWDWRFHGEVCEHFDNSQSAGECTLGFTGLGKPKHKDGVLKPKECMDLEDVTNG